MVQYFNTIMVQCITYAIHLKHEGEMKISNLSVLHHVMQNEHKRLLLLRFKNLQAEERNAAQSQIIEHKNGTEKKKGWWNLTLNA